MFKPTLGRGSQSVDASLGWSIENRYIIGVIGII